MLKITIPERECFNDETNEFIYIKSQKLQLEHSLVSLSKWESKWKKPFLDSRTEQSREEILDYVRCMTLTQNVDPDVYLNIDDHSLKIIEDYINDSMTATTFFERESKTSNREKITSELIYYWMISFGIPLDCQKWHLNRLMTLIRICNIKQSPEKKMSKAEIMKQNAKLNAARRKKSGSKG